MKPQKKAIVAQKAPKSQPVGKKRNKILLENTSIDLKRIKKINSIDNTKKLSDSEQKKFEKLEKCKKIDEKKRKDCKVDKMDDKKKLNKDVEKKFDVVDEKKIDKMNDRVEEFTLDVGSGAIEKKKNVKSDDKVKIDKQLVDSGKKKIEKGDDKKKVSKEDALENDPSSNSPISEENFSTEEKDDIQNLSTKKKGIKDDEKRKKDGKNVKSELKESSKNTATKDKKLDMKKVMKSHVLKKTKSIVVKKDLLPKNSQKKLCTKKIIVGKKSNAQLNNKLMEKKSKLVKSTKEESSVSPDEDEESTKEKKNSPILKNKINREKKPKLAKQMKAKIPPKNGKINNILKKDKLKKITDKIVMKKKMEMKEHDKVTCDINKKLLKDEQQPLQTDSIKTEICNDKEDDEIVEAKSPDSRKCSKGSSKSRVVKKFTKKSTKPVKSHDEDCDKVLLKTEDASSSDSSRQSKCEDSGVKSPSNSKRDTENPIKMNLKMETSNCAGSENQTSPSDSDNDYVDEIETRKNRQKKKKKYQPDENDDNDEDVDEDDRDEDSSNDEQKRMRLLDFWSGPKRRVASLNALAKVHCMYENEAGGVYLGGYCKPKPEKDKPKKASTATAIAATKDDKEELSGITRKEKDNKKPQVIGKSTSGNNVSKRNLRNVPGLRGKHWDMVESSTSSSSTSDEDESANEQIVEKTVNKRGRKKNTTVKKKKNEEIMDLKDMVVCKRMASLNASAMLAASYSDEKNRNSSSSETSSDSEVEIIKRRRQHGDTEADRRKARQDEEAIKSSKKVVIVNQDTDVTITGVYVNQTRSTHHEGFCSIAGMQYRISSTSHTQTAATAVAAELHEQQKVEPPCKSYTPLGALSSMQPPGSQGSHPNMSPRRHSAFTAPHQHGYYQPAGPLIQHPPTLPPIKGPPPEPTPTPPQNSEGSDDLVATSTTSGGTNSTGNSWRSYRKTESRVASSAIPSTSIVPTGGGFYRAYCPQYYGTPPQYQELCYPPTYPHPHPPPYYKYAPAYRRQYYGYPEAGGGAVAGGAGAGAPPGVVEYPPPPPGEYPMPPYYGGYPPPPPPPPPPPNPAYLHSQGRPIVDHAAFQGCPCPMQSCPKNVDTGPLIGNGKGAPVASGPGLSLPPSALVGPPSPARGLAGLAPPHGANAWDTDRVQLNNHHNLNQNQQLPTSVAQHKNIINDHCRSQNNECRTKEEKLCIDDKMSKCSCQKRACTSTCEVKLETLSPIETTELPSTNLSTENLRELKQENNNVKCESCSVGINDNISCAANCNVKCETTDFKCEIIKCEQCMKEGQMAILEIDKDSGILLIDDKLEVENGVKEELNDVVVVDSQNWIKPDYEATVTDTIEENDNDINNDNDNNDRTIIVDELQKCQKVVKRKLSLDSLSCSPKKRKVNKRTLSVGSSIENSDGDRVPNPMNDEYFVNKCEVNENADLNLTKKKQQLKKENNKRKIDDINLCESTVKKSKSTKHSTITNGITNCLKSATTDTSIMETINDVIEQSVQMTNKKDIKCKQERDKIDKKKKTVNNLMSIIKKVPKTLVKAVVAEKLCISKNEMKNIKELKTNKFELKSNKIKIPENNKCKNKVKAKIVEMKSKVFDSKIKMTDNKMKELTKKIDTTSKTKLVIDDKYEDIKKAALVKKKKKSTKKTSGKKSCGNIDDNTIVSENCSLTKKPFLKPKWSNGWSWEGESYEAKVYLTNEESAIRRCYESMRHVSGDVLRPRDCVLLKSGPRKADLPFVAKIAALWENPDDGEMMFSLLWYYRPEHTEQGRTEYDTEDEVFASRHRDANSVACIEDKCYILTFNEYCRYRKNLRRTEEGLDCPGLIVPPGEYNYPRESRQPPIPVPSDIVLFCRRVYDYRGKKLVKNPG